MAIRYRTWLAVLAVLIIGASACGDDSEPAANPDQPSTDEQPSDASTSAQDSADAAEPADAAAPEPEAPEPEAPEPEGPSGDVRWFIGLGTGTSAEQVEVQEQVVAAFTGSRDGIDVELEIVGFEASRDTLSTEIASGNPPDVLGPVGILGAAAFQDEWLDLTLLIEQSGYDVSQFDPASLEVFAAGGEGLYGIPIALYPSMVFYNTALFDEAGLNYPPQQYGDPYVWPDGTEAEWNFDTYREVAMRLTVDANGLDATQDGFDPDQIVQYGFDLPWADVRYVGNYFGAGTFIGDDGQTAVVPDQWLDGWRWYHDGIWVDHFIPSAPVRQSADFGSGEPFAVGRAATTLSHLWYTGSLFDLDDWDMAAVPSHNGVTTSNLHADTFRILKGSGAPEAAFEFLTYAVDEAAGELVPIYGGMPALASEQAAWTDTMSDLWAHGVNWQVAIDGVQFADSPNNESWLPRTNESLDYLFTVISRWQTTPGLDMDAEAATVASDLQALWDQDG